MSDWIIGKHAVEEALRSGRRIDKILLAKGIQHKNMGLIHEKIHKQNIPYQWVPRVKLDQLSKGKSHQGVMAQVAAYSYSSVEIILSTAQTKGEPPFLILLDGIEDPHNLGSIIRTADAAGAHGVVIPKKRAVGITSVVAKTSAGAIEHVPVARVTNLNRFADELKQSGIWLIGTNYRAEISYDQMDYDMPLALVIGSEGKGISRLLKEKCDFLVRLPMLGKVSSLNASVAAGIFLYEVVRGRRKNGSS